ncbi:hypothetical protein J4Q44_G00308760, partial [Coregonus suidteri]
KNRLLITQSCLDIHWHGFLGCGLWRTWVLWGMWYPHNREQGRKSNLQPATSTGNQTSSQPPLNRKSNLQPATSTGNQTSSQPPQQENQISSQPPQQEIKPPASHLNRKSNLQPATSTGNQTPASHLNRKSNLQPATSTG